MEVNTCHNGFPPRLGRPQKYGVATDLFCTGVIGHPGHVFLNWGPKSRIKTTRLVYEMGLRI